jgi:hypothetical protein
MFHYNFNKIFDENPDAKFFYTDYPGTKLVDGWVSLKNAKARKDKDEFYALVTYHDGEELPEEYVPIKDYESEDGTLFATINPDYPFHFFDICRNAGIQRITELPSREDEGPRYLLGPGPDEITLAELINTQYDRYMGKDSTQGRGR